MKQQAKSGRLSPVRLPLRLALIACLVVSLPVIAGAHISGQSFEKKVGDYLVDAGCDALTFVPDQKNFCNFGLIENAGTLNWDYAPFDEVHVAISADGTDEQPFREEVKLLAPIPAFIVYAFPHTGAYTMNVRFLENRKLLAETSFPVTVSSPPIVLSSNRFWAIIGGGILLVAGVYTLMEAARKHLFA